MGNNFTPAQQKALDISGRNVLVSAAAGSGKTFTLTQRIIKNILEKNADISRILVVTFTRSAAAELKTRISSALMDAIAKNPENTHLQKQLLLLGDASISTIDSFISGPVKENFEKLGLPPSMRLLETSEANELYDEILDEVMELLYEKYNVCPENDLSDIDYSSPLTDLISLLTTMKDSSKFYPYVIDLYKRLITAPLGVGLLHEFELRLYDDSKKDFLKTREGKYILSVLDKIIEGADEFFSLSRDLISCDDVLRVKYLPVFDSDREFLNSLYGRNDISYDDMKRLLFAFKDSTCLGRLSANEKTPLSTQMREDRTVIYNQIKSFRDSYFTCRSEDISVMYSRTAEITHVLYEMLYEFDQRLMARKIKLGVYEFSDMPRYMLSLLRTPEGEKSSAAISLAESFDEIYIDEYQDVNEIQDEIFCLIGRMNRYMVGDLKQSIYGFRDAEPIFFTNYRNTYPEYDDNEASIPEGSTIFMSNNFRSDENVIKFSNTVCGPMFRSCGADIGYTDSDDLVFTKKCPEGYVSPKVQVNIFAKGLPEDASEYLPYAEILNNGNDQLSDSEYDEETVTVANEIARLIREGKKSNGKKIRPGDIAVLVRKIEAADPLLRALSELGIECLLASKSQLLKGREMTMLACLCEIIDNPRADIPLSAVLTCEYMPEELKFSMGEIISIRDHASRKLSLYDAICLYGDDGIDDPLSTLLPEKCRDIRALLARARDYSVKLSVDKFLRVLSGLEGFSSFCEGEAFKFMYDSACKYVKNSWNGLSAFIKYFKKVIKYGSISGEVHPIENSVNIVTMHSSKGLQYNTCFLYKCGAKFNTEDLKKSMIYDRHLCLGMHIPEKLAGEVNTVKTESIIRDATILDIKNKSRAEEMRLLYVAMTRAEERLYISGTVPGNSTYKSFFKGFKLYGVSKYSTFDHDSLLSWVIGGMAAKGHDRSSYDVKLHSIYNNTPLCAAFENTTAEKSGVIDEKSQAYAALIADPPSLGKEEIILSSIPAKAAASKVSDKMLDESIFSTLPAGILFSESVDEKQADKADNIDIIKNRIELMRSSHVEFDSIIEINKKPTASERGTAMHLFLQYCNYENIKNSGVKNEISRLIQSRFISQRTADILYVNQLERFFLSDFTKVLLNAESIRREFKFGMFRNASEFTKDKELSKLVKDRKIYVQGSIDLLIENPDGSIYVCDYKTDRISTEERADRELLRKRMRETHAEQLEQYKYAVEKIFKRKPDKIFVISLALGEALEI